MGKNHERDFKLENYKDFYEDHLFESIGDDGSLNAHRRFPRVSWALDVAKDFGAKSVLDLGCLEGFTLLTIAKHAGIERGVGVDLSADGIELAKGRVDLVDGNIEFIQDSLERYLENSTEKFDLICLFEIMEHVVDPELVIKLVDKVKSKNGQVLISTPSFESPLFGKNDVVNKCHIRLYTTKDEDYEEMTDRPDPDTGLTYMRTATSITKQIGNDRIQDIGVYSHLINVRYK